MRFIASAIDQNCSFSDCELSGEANFSHTVVGGDFDISDSTCAAEVTFEDFRCHGKAVSFEESAFGADTEFAFAEFPAATVSLENTTFEESVWFVQALFGKSVDFSGARFDDFAHLRSAEFNGDLTLRECDFNGQSFIHGSTIQGSCKAVDANFSHFQFGATVNGDIDFSGCQFDKAAIFSRSEVGGDAVFDNASFAGNPDFSDSTFKNEMSFENTEFLVEPTFEGTRFTNEPNFETASYPASSQQNLSERRRMNMIVARPEKLQHSGLTLPVEALNGDITVPIHSKPLLEPNEDLSRVIAQALNDIDQSEWYGLSNDSIELARTAVSELKDESEIALAFGVSINKGGSDPASFLEEVTLLGVFEFHETESEFCFGHLNPDLENADIVIVVAADDDAFESGVTVGTSHEFRKAILKRQVLHAELLAQDEMVRVVREYLPLIVASADIDL
jgi:uncharacterized protein YjbI with pentapeptide repeats